MRSTVLLFMLVAAVVAIAAGVGWWRYSSSLPARSHEIVQLDEARRAALIRLKNENKFEPHEYPPLGYTGIATAEDGMVARRAVNGVLTSILSHDNGPISAVMVSDLIGRAMKRVELLETEDRERTAGYMVEIWYLLGFKGATGQFAYGSAFSVPEGYGEPLPPGWASPDKPRPIDR